MCTFVEQPLTLNMATSAKPLTYEVFLKPTPEKEYYRFRLLWFKDGTDRKLPYVERYMHNMWIRTDDKNELKQIVCPTTSHVRSQWAGNPYEDCPICRFSANNYIAAKESGFKDKIAHTNYKQFRRNFTASVPVYVVNDPVYDANNGKIKVFSINDKAIFDKFKRMIVERNKSNAIFNSADALDFLIRVDVVQKSYTDRNGETVTYTKQEIVQMGFSNKPYTIEAITKAAVDEFPFADLYYSAPTLDELKTFYKKHCLHAAHDDDDVDLSELSDMTTESANDTALEQAVTNEETVAADEDVDILDTTTTTNDSDETLTKEAEKATITSDMTQDDTEDLISAEPADVTADIDINSLIAELDL